MSNSSDRGGHWTKDAYSATQELPPLHSQNPSQELTPPTSRKWGFGWGSGSRHHRNKLVWRRRIQREMLIQFLDEYCEEESNKRKMKRLSKMNKGYAFVNFTKAEAVSKFKAA
ncbi:hypothetical protein IGI04_016517 [Brassica rapa subsp. trilocularis]|uniref:RRM domain-containing protein n=1 Tax=Brassica rapa subsp. trilocularis TaxID=1813537 RepID=A0ABQ7MT67_BRACM|nr:hypothetical protein IGI04_016517 [Brassica rapa subsp. trilocularis]